MSRFARRVHRGGPRGRMSRDLVVVGAEMVKARDTESWRAHGYTSFDEFCVDVITRRAPTLAPTPKAARELARRLMGVGVRRSMAELLEYMIRVAGGAVAAGEVDRVAGSFDKLGESAARASEESAAGGSKLMAGLGAVSNFGVGLGLVLGATAIKAADMSNTFQTEMLKIRTETGASSKEFNHMRSAVLNLASSGQSMGQGPTSLAQGLYHLESMGFRGQKALLALKLASQEAAISGANLEDTTSAIGGAMFSGIKGTKGLTDTVGQLVAIAGSGNMRFQNLNEALGTGLLPTAKLAGLSLKEVGAALDVLTDAKYPASSAAAQLATSLHYLYDPSIKGADALARIGLSGNKLASDMRKPNGLLLALRDLRDHMSGLGKIQQQDILGDILPGGRGRVLESLYDMQNRLAPKGRQIDRISGSLPAHVREQQRNPATKLGEGNAKLQASMVKLGDVVTKYLTPALVWVEKQFSALITLMAKAPEGISKVISLFKGAAGSATGSSFLQSAARDAQGLMHAMQSLWAAAVPAFDQIGAAAQQAFGGSFGANLAIIGRDLLKFATYVTVNMLGTVKNALPAIVMIFKGTFTYIAGLVAFVADILTGKFGKAFGALKQMFKGELQILKGIFLGGINLGIIDPINTTISLLDKIPGVNIHKVGLLGASSNSPVKSTGLQGLMPILPASSHRRAKMTGTPGLPPALRAPAHESTHHQVVHETTNMVVDGKVLAQHTRKYIRAAMVGGVA